MKETKIECTRQKQILDWIEATFGPTFGADITRSSRERALRFLEEAVETAQAGGVPRWQAVSIVHRAFDRPVGEIAQEIGGAFVCLEALAEAVGIDADAECEREFARVQTTSPEERAARHAAKKAEGLAQ